MNKKNLENLLNQLVNKELTAEEAMKQIQYLPFAALTHSNIDTHRHIRCGFEEVVFAESKSEASLQEIIEKHLEMTSRVLVTRLTVSQQDFIKKAFPDLNLNPLARTACFYEEEKESLGRIGIISAGTSDAKVAEEAEVTAKYFNLDVVRKNDLGVAGLPRLLSALEEINQLDALIVIAGMEGALPSVLSGLTSAPVVAVPTSVGYGANLGGITALFSMLISCSPGVSVVNIDNGFGAALVAAKFIRQIRKI
ncbi:MAG: nickel pincer cofactor biosynthesis protein LarB [Proteobacteria bacterium]|nr:nickel pincer cofactor biosynthesis protein LarB [Pseudomonadota bacterium]